MVMSENTIGYTFASRIYDIYFLYGTGSSLTGTETLPMYLFRGPSSMQSGSPIVTRAQNNAYSRFSIFKVWV